MNAVPSCAACAPSASTAAIPAPSMMPPAETTGSFTARTMALARAIVRAVKLPVVSAGGIMDGAGIAAVLALGAQAAQLGTAFIPCPESGAADAYKRELLNREEDETRITDKFSGKPARGLVNRYMKEMQRHPVLAFPCLLYTS